MRATVAMTALALLAGGAAAQDPDSDQGPADIAIADDFERGASATLYRFRQNGAGVTAVQYSGNVPAARCGDTLSLEGVRQGGIMSVNQARNTGCGAAAGQDACSPGGVQNVAVILAAFPGVRPPTTTASALHRMLFDESTLSMSNWHRRVSYGRVSFTGSVFGPYTLDRAYDCREVTRMQAAAIRASGRDIDFSRFQRFILIFPPIRDCAFGAMSTLGCGDLPGTDGLRASWIWANDGGDAPAMLDLLIHEMGHSLGLGHSQLLRFPGDALEADSYRAVPLEYGDGTSAMGNGRFGDLAAAHKAELGWLDRDAGVAAVERDGEYVLAPLAGPSGTRALRIRRPAGEGEWLWLEYRRLPRGGVPVRGEPRRCAAAGNDRGRRKDVHGAAAGRARGAVRRRPFTPRAIPAPRG